MPRRLCRVTSTVTSIACLLLIAGSGEVRGAGDAEKVVVPAQLLDLQGQPIDVGALVSNQRLFFVTLKATWCPVCREQLRRLRALLPRLRSCGATFVVLAPGPRGALRQVAEETGFPYPFVEDVDFSLARAAGLRLRSSRRSSKWMQATRSCGSSAAAVATTSATVRFSNDSVATS